MPAKALEREEYIEQTYFFETFRERLLDGLPAQQVLEAIGDELLANTKLPLATSYLATEIRVSGLMAPAMVQLAHYFTPFQAHVIRAAEQDRTRFTIDRALLILAREAKYKANGATPPGLFVYHFEALSRNRLGFTEGLAAVADDPAYDEPWHDFVLRVQARLGDVDFADLLFVHSEHFLQLRRRKLPDFQPKFPILFGLKEGKIARANRGRDPLYLFSALQRQLGYPEVPRPLRPDSTDARVTLLEQRVQTLEQRLKTAEAEIQGGVIDLDQFRVSPEETAGTPKGWGTYTIPEEDLEAYRRIDDPFT